MIVACIAAIVTGCATAAIPTLIRHTGDTSGKQTAHRGTQDRNRKDRTMTAITDRLPMADVQYPLCGACGGETYHDGDSLRCDDCKLTFDSNSLEAEYADEEDATCGAACTNSWHGDNMIRPGWGYDCGTCILPAGHTSDHYTGCKAKEIAS